MQRVQDIRQLAKPYFLRKLSLGALQPAVVLPRTEATSRQHIHHLIWSLAVLPQNGNLSWQA